MRGELVQVAGMELPLMFSTGTATSFSGIAPSWPVYNDELARGYPVTDTPILFLQGTLDGQTEQQCVRGKMVAEKSV